MKVTRSKIDPRKKDKIFTTEGILGYDVDNLYPQRVTNIYNSSGVATTCIDVKSSFIEGGGFADETFYNLVINSEGLTNDKLLRFISREIVARNGFALHVNYDANGKITEVYPIPFADCRLPDPKKEDHKNQIAVCDKWDSRPQGKEITWINRFNPQLVNSQVESLINGSSIKTIEEAWKAYKGQIYWYSTAGKNHYPLAPFDAVLEDMESDGAIKKQRRKKIRSGSSLDYFFIHKGKFESDNEKDLFRQDLENFQGEDGSTMCLVDLEQDEEKPELLPVPQPQNAGKENLTEKDVQENIRMAFGIPGVLIGQAVQGALGLNTMITESYSVMNALTDKHRRLIEETMQIIFSLWYTTANKTDDYSIILSTYDTGESAKPLAVQFGVGGTQAMQAVLTDPLLTNPKVKINILRITFGFTKEEAEAMVLGTDLPEEAVTQ